MSTAACMAFNLKANPRWSNWFIDTALDPGLRRDDDVGGTTMVAVW